MSAEWLARLVGEGGQGWSRARLHVRQFEPWMLAAILAVTVAAVLLAAWGVSGRRDVPRAALMVLRLVAAALVLVLILGPAVELERATRRKSHVAVLVDVSRSMSLDDGGKTRYAEAVAALSGPALKAFLDGRDADVYTFGAGLKPSTREGLETTAPEETASDIGAALADLARRQQDRDLAAVVVVSDGGDAALAAEGDLSARVGDWPRAPILALLAGDAASFKDVAVVHPRAQSLGFVRHALSFEAVLAVRGLAGRKLVATLKQDGAPVQSQELTPRSGAEELPLSFSFTPTRPGTFLYTIEVPPVEGEATLDNNLVGFAVTVRRDQIRVLLLAGRPSWDVRFLRSQLKRDPNVDLVSFFILRDPDDPAGVPQDELSLIPFPVSELFTSALSEFDVVIFQDFGRRQFLTATHLENLRRFVEDGGGFAMIGGELSFGDDYVGSPLEAILPVALATPRATTDATAFRPVLTAAGRRHYLTRLDPDGAETESQWNALAQLDGVNVVGPLKPGSVALLEHPRLKAEGRPMPVLVVGSAGRGRTLALTVDTGWYWGFREAGQGGTNLAYQALWRNAVRWLAHDDGSKFVSLEVSGGSGTLPVKSRLMARTRRNDYGPLAGGRVTLSLTPASGGAAVGSARGVTGADGRFELEVAVARAGFYRARAVLEEADGQAVDEDERLLAVGGEGEELADPAPRPELLARLAAATHGQVLEASGRPPRLDEAASFRAGSARLVPLWDNAYVLSALLAVLAGEWWLRRRSGLH